MTLFTKCVLSSAGGKWGWNADAVRICRYEHKEIRRICLLIIWPGEWLNGSGWPSAITTAGTVLQNLLRKHLILRGRNMPSRLQLQRCIFCSRVPSFLMCSLSLIMLSAANSDNDRVGTEQPQFKYWALVLDFQLCVLRLVRWVRCGDYHPWNVRLNVCPGIFLWTMWVSYEMSNFQLAQLLLPWSILLCGNQNRGKGVATFVDPSSGILLWTDSLYWQTSVQRKIQMFQGSLMCTALCVCD